MQEPDRRTTLLAFAALASASLVFLAVYVTSVGHGFVLDDFAWIVASRVRELADWPRFFLTNNGFYRPLVSVSFATDYALFANRPLGYGLTNLMLAILSGMLIVRLLWSLRLPLGPAIFGGFVWLLNFHGINMAVLWISGRTALLLVAASVSAAIAVVEQRIALAVVCLLAALFSKEEAVLLPAVLASWQLLLEQPRSSAGSRIKFAAGAALALTVYFALRIQSGAMTPTTAPYYYRFTFEPTHVTRNLLEYADRTLTYPTLVSLLALALLRNGNRGSVRLDVVKSAIVWIVGGFGLTLFVPGRSNIYVCLPSVGSALLAAAICTKLWNAAAPGSRKRALTVAILIPLACAPLYLARNRRYVANAEFSARVLADLEALTADLPSGSPVVIVDDRSSRTNMYSAFGTLVDQAYAVQTGRQLRLWVEPPIPEGEEGGMSRPCNGCERRRLAVRAGRVVRDDRR